MTDDPRPQFAAFCCALDASLAGRFDDVRRYVAAHPLNRSSLLAVFRLLRADLESLTEQQARTVALWRDVLDRHRAGALAVSSAG